MTSSAPPLTDYGSKGYSKSKGGAITLQDARTTAINYSPNIFDNKVTPIEVNWEPKDISKL